MKKFLTSILVICLMVSIAACGKGNTDVTERNESEGTVSAQNETTKAPQETGKPASTGSISLEDVMNHPVTPAEDFEYEEDEETGGIGIMHYEGDDEIVVLPDTIEGKSVTRVEMLCFGSGSIVKGIRISDSVKRLDELSFGLNENLEVAVCGAGMKELGKSAFQDCVKLHTLILNDGLITIDDLSVSGCIGLKELEIPDSVTEIVNRPFFGASEGFTLIGVAGSLAEQTAEANGFSFRAK